MKMLSSHFFTISFVFPTWLLVKLTFACVIEDFMVENLANSGIPFILPEHATVRQHDRAHRLMASILLIPPGRSEPIDRSPSSSSPPIGPNHHFVFQAIA